MAVVAPLWRVRLLGAIEADGPGARIDRWPTRATAGLLARLALAPDRVHPREELVELLWPGVALDVGRNRLRQALSALKRLLEPPDGPAGTVLLADRQSIRLRPGLMASDVGEFEQRLRAGDLEGAHAAYRGELMPSFYDDWVIEERRRLAGLFERCEAAAAPAPSAPTATDTVAPLPTGLPNYWTRAFGAELTASRLFALVCAQRLVTVHGPGGSGKTRLAVEVAQALRDDRHWSIAAEAGGAPHFDRIAFVPLVDCVEVGQALDAIGLALRAEGVGEQPARIASALAGRRTLLVLDNVEQMVERAGPELARLLAASPTLHVLVTSRRLLEIDGEHAFELEGLTLPASEAAPTEVAANPAVALFVDRARAARAEFRLSPRDVAAVVGLVRLLGGMPLAIELAASRLRGLTPQDLLRRLSQDAGTPMLDLLARGAQRASPDARHASMRHVVDWSWRQLSVEQAAVLQALSVFANSACAAAVAAVADMTLARTQRLLDELHDASLLRPVENATDETSRYVLLQPVREFAAERQLPDEARLARRRLRQWLLLHARANAANGPAAIAPEVAHIHFAIVTAPADDAGRDALELALVLRQHWDSDLLPLSAVLALEHAAAALDRADADLRCDASELLAFARGAAGCTAESVVHAEAAVAGARDGRRRSLALTRWAWAVYMAGRFDEALDPALAEAGALASQAGDLYAQAMVLRMESIVTCNLRFDFARAEQLSAQTMALWEQLGNRSMVYLSLINRAMMWGLTGRGNDEAIAVLTECEQAFRTAGDWPGLIVATRQTGRVFVRVRRWEEAAAAFKRSLHAAWQRHATQGLAHGLLHLPLSLALCGRVEDAALIDGFAVANWRQLFNGINKIEARELRRARRVLRLRLGPARAEALRVQGRGLSLAAAVALALA